MSYGRQQKCQKPDTYKEQTVPLISQLWLDVGLGLYYTWDSMCFVVFLHTCANGSDAPQGSDDPLSVMWNGPI